MVRSSHAEHWNTGHLCYLSLSARAWGIVWRSSYRHLMGEDGYKWENKMMLKR